jgi:hypothetical protein
MHPELNAICTRLELAQASQNLACARAGGGETLNLPGALGVFLGPRHPFNQGLALGLEAALPEGELQRLEAFLGRGGAPGGGEINPRADTEQAARRTTRTRALGDEARRKPRGQNAGKKLGEAFARSTSERELEQLGVGREKGDPAGS